MLNQLQIIAPELLILALAICTQTTALFTNKQKLVFKYACALIIIIILYLFALLTFGKIPTNILTFSGNFFVSSLLTYLKILILIIILMSLVIYHAATKNHIYEFKIEFMTLILLASLGIFISISANNLLLLFCGLELQALASYSLTSFNTKNIKSSEAGLKYFVLGALMSCLMLFGISFIYGFSGTIHLTQLANIIPQHLNIGVLIGLSLFMMGILFKLSAAPLHVWTPDIYEGAPLGTLSFLATAQKIGALVILINLCGNVVSSYLPISIGLIKIAAIASMLIGAFGALRQTSLKRLIGYSTILNIGYVLIAVSLKNDEAYNSAFIYMFIYIISLIGLLACLLALLGKNIEDANFSDLSLANDHKLIKAFFTIIILSMIGLPPLAGFFGKYLIFYQAIKQSEFTLPIIGILTSVISAFYYLKIIKYLYFIEITNKIYKSVITDALLSLIIFCGSFSLCFSFLYRFNFIKFIFEL